LLERFLRGSWTGKKKKQKKEKKGGGCFSGERQSTPSERGAGQEAKPLRVDLQKKLFKRQREHKGLQRNRGKRSDGKRRKTSQPYKVFVPETKPQPGKGEGGLKRSHRWQSDKETKGVKREGVP